VDNLQAIASLPEEYRTYALARMMAENPITQKEHDKAIKLIKELKSLV